MHSKQVQNNHPDHFWNMDSEYILRVQYPLNFLHELVCTCKGQNRFVAIPVFAANRTHLAKLFVFLSTIWTILPLATEKSSLSS